MDRYEELTEFFKSMIRTRSMTGEEKNIADLIVSRMKKLGYDEAYTDERGSVIGYIRGTEGKKSVLLDGHMDTVAVVSEDDWSHRPFEAETADGKIYGRGAADMKGGLSAMIMAAGQFTGKNRCAQDIRVTGTVLEEVAEGWSLGYILKEVRPDLVIIGEATDLNLNIGQRGRGEILVETRGRTAHSSNPEVGVNAVYHMTELIGDIRKIPVKSHELLGDGIMELTDIISSPYPGASVVPDRCRVTFDRRLLPGDTEESVLTSIRKLAAERKKADPAFAASAEIASVDLKCYTGFRERHVKYAPAWCLDRPARDGLIADALEALQEAGLSPRISSYRFCTNGSSSAGILNIPTIGFGPCRESQAHVIDEYIPEVQLHRAFDGYCRLIRKFAG